MPSGLPRYRHPQHFGGTPIAEKDASGNWTDYIFAGGRRLAKATGTTSSGVTYYHGDHLGSTRIMTDSSGAVVRDVTYMPFGHEYSATGTGHYDFTGMEADAETGLNHTQFRQQSPVMGRWMSPDPYMGSMDLTNPQSLNRYAYALNNPLKFVDPTGLECAMPNGTIIWDNEWGVDNSDPDYAEAACGDAGGSYSPNVVSSQTNADLSQLPTDADNWAFYELWASGLGPQVLNYGPDDGMTKAIAASTSFNTIRQEYKSMGCPAQGPDQGSGHFAPLYDEANGNKALIQVGGYRATGSTSGNITTFQVKNTAGQASFSGATTFSVPGAIILANMASVSFSIAPVLGQDASQLALAPIANGTDNNPYGTQGKFHDIKQIFTWTETNLCAP